MIRQLLLSACLVLAVAACTTRPVLNVTDEPVQTAGKSVTRDQVRDAIVRAGQSLGWVMRPTAPGVVNARIFLRNHSAVVDVEYDAKRYSIVYRDSSNLDAGEGRIHKNYNGWIENLNNAIRRELMRL